MSNLDQAREWAEWAGKRRGVVELHANALAAAELIQSLPDEIVDGYRLRQIIDFQGASISDDARKDLESLITPSLPTLAELIEAGNDPKQYQWMQCNVEGRGDDTFVIAVVGERVNKVLLPDGLHEVKGNNQVTPLPDLPKLEWPDSGDAPTVAGHANVAPDQQVNPQVNLDSSLPRPEDVPAGEAWLVLSEGRRAIGYRNDPGDRIPWCITYQGCMEFDYCYDSDITLVSRLVPEVKP